MSQVTSCVKSKNGVEYLCVNGKRIDSVAYITYLSENGRYEDFASAGYTLFSLSLFFGTNNLNEMSGSRSFSKGIFDKDKPDFSELDANIARILAACPGAMILPRINVNPCEKWESEHPEELCDATLNPDPAHRRPCLASDLWLTEIKRMLSEFVAHIEASPYADHIIGY